MAASGGHLPVVQWLWTQFKDDPKVGLLCVQDGVPWVSPLRCQMALSACNGHLEIIQYLHTIVLSLAEKKRKRGESSRHPCEIEMDVVVTEAARHGYMDVVQWLCTHATVKSFEEAIAGAAGRGHFPVVKWLHENRPNEIFQDEVMDEAAASGDLPLLKWLHSNRPNKKWSTDGIEYAAQGGHLHTLRWLLDNELLSQHENDVPVDAMNLALKRSHFDALLFLYNEYKDRSSDGVKLEDDPYCIYNEHLEDWFQEEMGYSD